MSCKYCSDVMCERAKTKCEGCSVDTAVRNERERIKKEVIGLDIHSVITRDMLHILSSIEGTD